MNQGTIHPADCRCSKCPGTHDQRPPSLRLAVGLYVLVLVIAFSLIASMVAS